MYFCLQITSLPSSRGPRGSLVSTTDASIKPSGFLKILITWTDCTICNFNELFLLIEWPPLHTTQVKHVTLCWKDSKSTKASPPKKQPYVFRSWLGAAAILAFAQGPCRCKCCLCGTWEGAVLTFGLFRGGGGGLLLGHLFAWKSRAQSRWRKLAVSSTSTPPHTHTLHTQKKRRHIKHPCDVKNLIFPDLNRLKWKQPLMLFLPPHVPYLSFHNLLWQKKHLPLWHQDWLNLSYLMFKSNEGEGRCGQKVLGDWQCSGVESDARSTETQMEAPLKYRWGCTVGICLEFTKCRCSINYNSL